MFRARSNTGTKTKDATELLVGWLRQGTTGMDLEADVKALRRLGQEPFGWITPDGYPEEGEAWLGTSTLMQRWILAQEVSMRLVPQLLIGPVDTDPDFERLVDDLVLTLIGRPVSERSRANLRETFPADAVAGTPSLRSLIARILQLPEAQLQ